VRKPFNWLSLLLSSFLRIGVEKSGGPTANSFDVEAAEVRRMALGVDVKIDPVDDTVQSIYDIQKGVSDGAQANHEQLSTPG
jgi:hypothetical protein